MLTIGSLDLAARVLSLTRNTYDHRNNLRWSEMDYFLQVRQVRVDIMNNVREDVQDIYEKDLRILDTGLVVAVLILDVGFGFVVEGTFPERDPSQKMTRRVYAVVAALALIFPFFSLIGLLEARRRLRLFMKLLSLQLSQMSNHENTALLSRHITRVGTMVEYSRKETGGLPHWNCLRMCSRRARATTAHLLDPLLPGESEHVESEHLARLRESFDFHNNYLDFYSAWVENVVHKSGTMLVAGAMVNLLCATMMLGMRFQTSYPDTPAAWKCFTLISLWGWACAVVGQILALVRSPSINIHSTGGTSHGGIPPWAVQALVSSRGDGMHPAEGPSEGSRLIILLLVMLFGGVFVGGAVFILPRC